MDQNFSAEQRPWAQGGMIHDCPDMERLLSSQKLKEAMDRHSVSACNTAWIMLGFSLFGIISNSVSLSVFSHHSMRCAPVNVLLAGLSCIDLFLSIFVIPVFVVPALNLYYRWELVDRALPYVTFALYPLTLMTQTASVWVFVVITCERWGAVVRPLQTRRYSSVSNAKKAFCTVCVMAVLYNLIRFGEFRLVVRQYQAKIAPAAIPDCAIKLLYSNVDLHSLPPRLDIGASENAVHDDKHSNLDLLFTPVPFGKPVINEADRDHAPVSEPLSPSVLSPLEEDPGDLGVVYAPELEPRLRYDATYMFFYYFGLYLLTHFIVPFFILLIVNIHVVWTILRTRALRRHLTTHERREHRIALMMGVVVVAFLLCNTIPFAMNLLEAYDRDYFRRVETLYLTHLVNDIGNLLVVVNSSTTSLIYYAFSQRYRRQCVANLCFKKTKKRSIRLRGRSLSLRESFRAELDQMTELCATTPRLSRETSPRRFNFNESMHRKRTS